MIDMGVEGRTERWVKFSITAFFIGVAPIIGGFLKMYASFEDLNARVIVQEERTAIYSRDRMELDRTIQSTLLRMVEQNDKMLDLMKAIAGDDTYQRQVQRERDRYRSDHTPVFPAVK